MQAAVDALQLGYSERQEVVDVAFRFLAKPRDCPVIVAGDLGVGLSTVHAYIRSCALQEKVQTHCVRNQNFHTFFRSAKPGYRCISINTDSQRMIACQIEINDQVHMTDVSSGGTHPAAMTGTPADSSSDPHPTDTGITRRQRRFTLCCRKRSG